MSAHVYMTEAELTHLGSAYRDAKVILEYGSGGATRLAADMPGKLIMSVDCDLERIRRLRRDLANASSPAMFQHVDIGRTGFDGRPLTDRNWRAYHRYPNSVWDEPWFRQPDTLFIAGPFRSACLATAILRTKKPVRVIFDGYALDERYKLVEHIVKPRKVIGRMAEFLVNPDGFAADDIGYLVGQYFQVEPAGKGEDNLRQPQPDLGPNGPTGELSS